MIKLRSIKKLFLDLLVLVACLTAGIGTILAGLR